MSDEFKLAEAMGWKWDDSPNQFAPGMGRWWFKGLCKDWSTKEKLSSYFDPLTDANDERAVLRFICGNTFSVRLRFFDELDRIVQERLDIKGHAAWPGAMMYMQDGDIARAALKVLE